MWKTIKIRNPEGWLKVEALVCGIWAAHKAIGGPHDPDYDWSVTHVPTGTNLDLGPISSVQATAVATRLGCSVRHRAIPKLIEERWLIRSLAAEAIAAPEVV